MGFPTTRHDNVIVDLIALLSSCEKDATLAGASRNGYIIKSSASKSDDGTDILSNRISGIHCEIFDCIPKLWSALK